MSSPDTDRQAIDRYIADATNRGYRVVSRSEDGVQLARPKQWNVLGMFLFILVPIIGGFVYSFLWFVALIGAIIVILDYALRKEQLEYVTAAQARERMNKPKP